MNPEMADALVALALIFAVMYGTLLVFGAFCILYGSDLLGKHD